MPLSCECPDSDHYDWYYEYPDGYIAHPITFMRGRRCHSCDCVMIRPGDLCVEFKCTKGDENETPLASKWLCERCGDMWFNLNGLGFCPTINDSMPQLHAEYIREYNPPKLEIEK